MSGQQTAGSLLLGLTFAGDTGLDPRPSEPAALCRGGAKAPLTCGLPGVRVSGETARPRPAW